MTIWLTAIHRNRNYEITFILVVFLPRKIHNHRHLDRNKKYCKNKQWWHCREWQILSFINEAKGYPIILQLETFLDTVQDPPKVQKKSSTTTKSGNAWWIILGNVGNSLQGTDKTAPSPSSNKLCEINIPYETLLATLLWSARVLLFPLAKNK